MSNKDDKNDNPDKVVKFPSLAERDRIRKKQNEDKMSSEEQWRKQYKSQNHEPFFKFGNIPPFTGAIISILIFIHIVLEFACSESLRSNALDLFAFTPAQITGDGFTLYTLLTPITYTFFHGDWMHLGFNAIMGLALCTFAEKMFSTPTAVKFFFLCTLGGALAYFISNPTTLIPMIGASGAISGLFAAVLMMLHEQGRFGAVSQKLAHQSPLKGAWTIVLIWAGITVLIGLMGGGIAWQAHLGGLLTGAILYTLMRKGRLRL